MKISADVIDVLTACTFDDSHALVFLPTDDGPLDRRLYVATDKVLKACGGKWNRFKKAHVFDSDARDRIELVITTGEVQTSSDIGFFPTPAPLAAKLVEMADVRAGMFVIEPSAGTGRIVDALLAVGATVYAVERDRKMQSELVRKAINPASKSRLIVSDCEDFMNYEPRYARGDVKQRDRVVMNPPFGKVGIGDHLDHVRHAHSMLVPSGILVSVLPSSVDFRKDRRHRDFREWVLERGTIEDLPEDSFRESGTNVRTCVVRMVA